MNELNYQALQNLIQHQNWWFDAAEIHGILSSLVALKSEDKAETLIFGKPENCPPLARQLFFELTKHIQEHIIDEKMDYQLILPSTTIKERAEALVYWVRGFKIALEFTGYQCKKDEQEFMDFLKQIIDLDCNIEETEANAQLLNVLEEHCRIGIFLLLK